MSTQKGNTHRSRPQKYQNSFAFKNTLHDTSKKTKTINSTQVNNVCERCKKIIEWKIKYKKYKPLKAPAKCNKCDQKTIKHAYHTMCGPCAKERNVCPKCENQTEIISVPTKEEQFKLDLEMQQMLKALPERKRRTFIRYMNKQTEGKKKNKSDTEEDGSYFKNDKNIEPEEENMREHLISKLKVLMTEKEKDIDDFDDFYDDDDDDEEDEVDENDDDDD